MHNKRREQGQASRESILAVTARLMSAHGYDGTSVSMIARESGLPASSIYWHFGSKEGILAAVMEAGAARFFNSFPDPEVFTGAPHARLVNALVETGTALMLDDSTAQFLRLQLRFRLNAQHHDDDAEFTAVAREVRRRGADFMAGWIRHAYAEYGAAAADRVARSLAEIGVSLIDGVFLAVQDELNQERVSALLTQAGEALACLADQMIGGEK